MRRNNIKAKFYKNQVIWKFCFLCYHFLVILEILFGTIAVTIFLYIFWKQLREDYISNQIFSTAFYLLIGMSVGALIADNFYAALSFWLIIVGLIIGFWMASVRYRMRFYETTEAAISGLLVILTLYHLYQLIIQRSIYNAVWLGITLVLLMLHSYLRRHYKKFAWYKSGKVGFTGFTVVGLYFLIRALIALFIPHMVSFLSIYDSIISGIIA